MAMAEQNLPVVAEINNYPVEKYNPLFPCTLTQLSPLHKVMVNIVNIDTRDTKGGKNDVYEQKNGGYSFTKNACLKLMTAANVIMEDSRPILPLACQRCVQVAQMTKTAPQCGSCPTRQDVAYQVSILVSEPSGGHRRYVATKEINKDQYLAKKAPLEHMSAQCETKALLRALRAGLGIKGAYTMEELKKPFAVALVVLNTTDPELKAALIQRYAAGESALFGAPKAAALAAPELQALPGGRSVNTETGEIHTVTVVSDDDDPPNFGDDEAPVFDDEPAVEETIFSCKDCGAKIAEYKDKSGKVWLPAEFAGWTHRTYGKQLCPACVAAENRKARGA